MNIYVGNLSFETTGDSLKAAFIMYGDVHSARVITDRMTGRSRAGQHEIGWRAVYRGPRADGEGAEARRLR